ncbi:MAG: potassium channel protein [Spirochaetota bacterium]|nr:potassium channel protein [Spirochaetota bacterium]
MQPTKRLVILILVLISILLIGTFGYIIIEGSKDWNVLDSFYFTLITLTTIGYTEVHTLTPYGRVFTIFLIFFGVGTTYYIITTSAQIILEGHLKQFFGRKRMNKAINKLKGHYIICGYGRIGRYICDELLKLKYPFILIESSKEKVEEIEKMKILYLIGNAANDEVLISAGIENARALIIVVGNDADSVFITLSGRGLNGKIYIIARYEQTGTDNKLLKAGANKVLSPHLLSGSRMIQLLLKPTVTDFLDLATSSELIELTFEEIKLKKESSLINKSLENSNLKQNYGVIVVGVKDTKNNMKFNPPINTILNEDDTLIVLGNFEQIKRLYDMEGIVRL